MNVLVDTSVWSLALRRARTDAHQAVVELTRLIEEGHAVMIGLVRQELLSGLRDSRQFESLRHQLRAFPDLELHSDDYEQAASFSNRCRARGVQGSTVDFLLCAVAARRELAIFTTDDDFSGYARALPIKLHTSRR